jgi:hypothetical protein
MTPSGFRPALRFHLETGVRVVLGLGSVQLVAGIAALSFHPQPLVALRSAACGVTDGSAFPGAGFVLAGLSLGAAALAARRLVPGARGWTLHLPVSATGQYRALLLALVASQALTAAAWIGFLGAGLGLGATLRMPYPLALPGILVSAACVVLPYSRRWERPVSGLALALSAWGSWPSLLAAGACLAGVVGYGRLSLVRGPERGRVAGIRRPETILTRISWAALGPGGGTAFLGALLPVAGAFFVLRNNPGISPEESGIAVRGGCGLGVLLVVLSLAGRLVAQRPPWAWSRSLPWFARMRVGHDAGFLVMHALPIVLVAAILDPRAAAATLVLGLYLALRGAGAMRSTDSGPTRLGWRMNAEGVLAVILVTAFPASAWGLLALAPLAWVRARNRERALKVSLIRERQYSRAGDSTC